MSRRASTRARDGWTRTPPPTGSKGASYHHAASGWTVRHCGHPTALWPYYATRPGTPGMLLTGGLGRGIGFPSLACAQLTIEHVARTGHVHTDRCWVDPPGDAQPYLTCHEGTYYTSFYTDREGA